MREPAGWSLRRRLVMIGASSMVAALLLGGVAMFWAETLEDRQLIDARLEQLGSTILSLIESDLVVPPGDMGSEVRQLKTRPTGAILYRYQVWTHDGVLRLRSHEAPADRPIADLQHRGFETVRMGGEDYRVFSLPTRDHGVVQVAECLAETALEGHTIAAYYVGLLLLPFGTVFLVSWLLTRRSLQSVDALAGELRRRNPLDVTSLDIANPPKELVPILNALDSLFARAAHAFSVERRFTSVAAHEMRTPLAGLRAQAQIASRARNEAESRVALAAIMQGVDRATLMLDQLLDLARIEGMSEDVDMLSQPIKLSDVGRDAIRELQAKARSKDIAINLRFEADELHAVRFGVYLMLRNLIANAVLYCPEGGRVDVHSLARGSDVMLIVDDSGPGIAPADRDRAFERFNRLGQNKVDGVGLGLSIVLRIVELHRARIELLEAPLGGLRVRILFPQETPPPSLAPHVAPARI